MIATNRYVHPDYAKWAPEWQKNRDVIAGQKTIQDRSTGTRVGYLPMLGGQDADEYYSYKLRGSFYGATARTIEALTGAVFRKDPIVEASDLVKLQLENVDLAGTPLDMFAKVLLSEVLSTGRYGVLLDVPARPVAEDGVTELDLPPDIARPYWTGYAAEDIVMWWEMKASGVTTLTRVELREQTQELNAKNEVETVCRYRILTLEGGVVYHVRIERETKDTVGGRPVYVPESDRIPYRATGDREPLTFIPFVFFGPMSLGPKCQKPPVSDLADVNLAHWRLSCDYAHGLHFTALPTPWLADKNIPKDKAFKIGSMTAWTMTEEGKAGMLEFSGAGMGAIKEAKLEYENQMSRLGAEMLAAEKSGVEAVEALRIRATSRTGSLASTAATCSWGLTKVAEWHSWWLGESDEQVTDTSITLNQDFVESRMEPAELTAWVAARQAGEVTRRMFVEKLNRAEELGEQDVEDVLDELELEQEARDEKAAMIEATTRANAIGDAMLETMKDKPPNGNSAVREAR